MNNKLIGSLGICRRAGHLTIGFDAVRELAAQHRAELIMTAADLSDKTAKELRFILNGNPAPLLSLPLDKAALSAAIGLQKPVGVIATDDSGFAASIAKHIPTELKEDDA